MPMFSTALEVTGNTGEEKRRKKEELKSQRKKKTMSICLPDPTLRKPQIIFPKNCLQIIR